MKIKKIVQAMAAVGLATCIAMPASSYAQGISETVTKVEITGSSIKRSSQESAGAVQLITRDEIERSGA